MGFVTLLVYIALVWLVVYTLKTLVPMEAQGSRAITVVAVVMTIFLVLWAFGVLPNTLNQPLPRLK